MRKERIIKKEYVIAFVALLILCYLFPYTGDDWAWGSQIGIDRLNSWFDNYSGRYFGNIIVLILTRSRWIRSIAMAGCLLGIIMIINKLTGQTKMGFYIIAISLLVMPVNVLRQSVVWTAGFANYSTSIFFTLVYIYYVKNIYRDEVPNDSKWSIVPLTVLGIMNTLIVEHLTLYNIVLAIYVIVYTFVKFKKVLIQHIAYLAGCVLGTIYMFSNPVYRSVAEGTDGYRSVGGTQGIVSKAQDAYFNVIMQEGVLNNVILNVLLLIMCLIVWKEIKSRLTKKIYIVGISSVTMICSYTIISIMNAIGNAPATVALKYIQGIATILYALALIVFYIILPIEFNKKVKFLFVIGSIACIMAPLLVVSPIGSRCFFATYILFIYLILETYNLICRENRKMIEELTRYAGIIMAVSFFYILYIYGTIFVCDKDRVDRALADADRGSKTIEVENLPYSSYVWCANPDTGSVWEERFKLFYGINKKVKIKNIQK